MLEWYQPGYSFHELMDEVETLVLYLLNDHIELKPSLRMTYQSAFEQYLHINPHTATARMLAQVARDNGIQVVVNEEVSENDRDFWLDLLLTHVIEPSLEKDRCVFMYDYPASQAALAKIETQGDIQVARRFELYLNKVELANGYNELSDAAEQQKRFERDISAREKNQKPRVEQDKRLLQALEYGLPECSGVAMGLDRLLMLAVGADSLYKVLAFPFENA
jgi:lysyl-tRNA synthetase class 2